MSDLLLVAMLETSSFGMKWPMSLHRAQHLDTISLGYSN